MSESNVVRDYTGVKFNRLTGIRFYGRKYFPDGKSKHLWEWKCDCGKVVTVLLASVKSGNTKSCGCLYDESRGICNITHGHTKSGGRSRLYSIWAGMNQRCNNPKCPNYEHYGQRGIKLLWKSFDEFLEDMGKTYKSGSTIDRINNDGHYCKENCRWATMRQQSRNRRNNVLITWNGQTKPVCAWAEQLGIAQGTFLARIKYGWPIDEIMTTPLRKAKTETINGVTKTLLEWCELNSIQYSTFHRRLKLGWPIQKALFEPVTKYNV